MGIIIPNETGTDSTGESEAPDYEEGVAVLASSPPTPAGGPDAYLLNRADFPSRNLPKVTGVRDARYQVVFRQSVLDQIHEHGKSSPEAEVCGVLIGDVYADEMAPWAYVEHCIRGNNAVGKQTQVTITSETWTRIHETLEKEYPGKKIVGWYHTHPGFGIFLSGMDLFIQDNFFNQPWQVATVYDPHSGDEGTFIWRTGQSVRETSLVENDTGALPPNPTDAINELNRRIKRLERRLDVILTGFLFILLVALSGPLIIFSLAPDTVRYLPNLRHVVSPGTSKQPTTKPATGSAAPKASTPTGAHSKVVEPSDLPDDEAPAKASPKGEAPGENVAPGDSRIPRKPAEGH